MTGTRQRPPLAAFTQGSRSRGKSRRQTPRQRHRADQTVAPRRRQLPSAPAPCGALSRSMAQESLVSAPFSSILLFFHLSRGGSETGGGGRAAGVGRVLGETKDGRAHARCGVVVRLGWLLARHLTAYGEDGKPMVTSLVTLLHPGTWPTGRRSGGVSVMKSESPSTQTRAQTRPSSSRRIHFISCRYCILAQYFSR